MLNLGGITWRRFTKEDWYGWAGATPFPSGDQPLIGEIRIDNHPDHAGPIEGVIIVSGENPGFIEITLQPRAESEGLIFQCTGPAALNALFSIRPVMDFNQLAQLGFERIN